MLKTVRYSLSQFRVCRSPVLYNEKIWKNQRKSINYWNLGCSPAHDFISNRLVFPFLLIIRRKGTRNYLVVTFVQQYVICRGLGYIFFSVLHIPILITHVRYTCIKILTWLRGFRVILLIWFDFLCAQISSENFETMEWKKKNAILTLKPRSHVRILIYQTRAIWYLLLHRWLHWPRFDDADVNRQWW